MWLMEKMKIMMMKVMIMISLEMKEIGGQCSCFFKSLVQQLQWLEGEVYLPAWEVDIINLEAALWGTHCGGNHCQEIVVGLLGLVIFQAMWKAA
jgi:hypothetical protein